MKKNKVAFQGELGAYSHIAINELFKENYKEIKIVNPISSDLNVLRNSIFPNLMFYLKYYLVKPNYWLTIPSDSIRVLGYPF